MKRSRKKSYEATKCCRANYISLDAPVYGFGSDDLSCSNAKPQRFVRAVSIRKNSILAASDPDI